MKALFEKYKDNFFLLILLNCFILLLFLVPRFIIPSFMLGIMCQVLAVIVSYTLRLHLVLLIVLFFFLLSPLLGQLKKISNKTWIILGLILIVGFCQFWFIAPDTHRVYFDEDIYANIAANIAADGRALKTNFGTPDQCYEGEYNKDPSGMPALISLFYSFLPVSEYLASRITVILTLLTAFLVFLLAYLLFKNELLSLFASGIFVLLPENIIWAPTIAAEPYFVFFAALTLLGILIYGRTQNNFALLFSLLSLAYAAQVRPEGLLLLLPVEFFLFFDRDFSKKLSDKFFVGSWLLFLVFLLPQFATFAAFAGESWGATRAPMFSWVHFMGNFKANFAYFFENSRTPLLVSLLAIIGIFPFRKWFKEKGLLLITFFVFFTIFLFFYAGSYNYGTDVRFSLILNLPLTILAACGILLLNSTLLKRVNSLALNFIWIILLVGSFVLVYPAIPIGEESSNVRASHDYMVEVLSDLPENSYMLSYDPCIVVINGRKGAQTFYATRQDVMDRIYAETDQVYFYKDIWSQIPPYSGKWRSLLKDYDLEWIKGLPFGKYNFDLYRMRRKS
ncbi:MAG: glycosyltransferase family 39 protein [Candidatus Saganbacteria bacterium]|nr:glycosyltransferase family 39 protein [Candidatus Saganbacteria bacterium]